MEYIVNVGNIGNIECNTRAEANKTYAEYVSQSKGFVARGRAYMEDVYLLVDGEPVKEFSYSGYILAKLVQRYDRKQKEADIAREVVEAYKLEIGEME
jgi:hypothetical protein